MNFIDTHLHLQDYKTRFATDIIQEAQAAGVVKMVCAATCFFDWDKVARLAKKYPTAVIPAFGLHPWYVGEAKTDWPQRLAEFLERFPNALIGECGLDSVKNTDDEPQNSIFYHHIRLAAEFKRPLIIHAVKAQDWLENYWKMLPEKFVFHSYNGKREVLKKIIQAEGYVSFSFSILRNKDFEELINMVPNNKILLETDGPYQSPVQNEEIMPSALPVLAKHVAASRHESFEDFCAQIYKNSLEFIDAGK